MGGQNIITRTSVSRSYAAAPMVSGVGLETAESVKKVVNERAKEKQEMSGLNEKLADLLNKTRLSEVTIKDLMDECERLRQIKGLHIEPIKEKYEDLIEDYKEKLAKMAKDMADAKADAIASDDKYETECLKTGNLQKTINDLNKKIREAALEIGNLTGDLETERETNAALQNENDQLEQQLALLKQDNDRLRDDERAAIAAQQAAESRCMDLEAELAAMDDAYHAELEAIMVVIESMKSSMPQREAMWQNEFKKTMKDIQVQYDSNLEKRLADQRMIYEHKMEMLQSQMNKDVVDGEMVKEKTKTLQSAVKGSKNEIADLKSQIDMLNKRINDLLLEKAEDEEQCNNEKDKMMAEIADLRAKLEKCFDDMKELNEENLSLEMEIKTYATLLNTEQDHLNKSMSTLTQAQSKGAAALESLITGSASMRGGGRGGSSGSSQQSASSSAASIRYSRKSQTPGMNFGACRLDGGMVEIKNNGRNDVDLSGWTIIKEGAKKDLTFAFQSGASVPSGGSVKVFAKAYEEEREANDFLADFVSWGPPSGILRAKDSNKKEKFSMEVTQN